VRAKVALWAVGLRGSSSCGVVGKGQCRVGEVGKAGGVEEDGEEGMPTPREQGRQPRRQA